MEKLSRKEIVEYYGQIYSNVQHMKTYVDSLVERYYNEDIKNK